MFFGFLGPNGAGKTTTISILCGLSTFQSGKIVICGMDLHKQFRQIKPHIGVAPQDIALYPELTIDENLRFVGNIYELPTQLLKQQINYYLESFGLTSQPTKKNGIPLRRDETSSEPDCSAVTPSLKSFS